MPDNAKAAPGTGRPAQQVGETTLSVPPVRWQVSGRD